MAKMSNGVILRMPPSCAHTCGEVCRSLRYMRGWRACGVRATWGGVPLAALSARLAHLRRQVHSACLLGSTCASSLGERTF